MKLKSFTKNEIVGLSIIFAVLVVVSVPNFLLSIQRSRDLTRKDDLMSIAVAAGEFQEKYFYFPSDLGSLSEFMLAVPKDPQSKIGLEYVYLSNGRRFQILASLEDKEQDEYNQEIEARGIACGSRVCNYGRASGSTPLNISIEEYEYQMEPKLNETKN
jgi:hypothetical protein